jgi:hypothetical protein
MHKTYGGILYFKQLIKTKDYGVHRFFMLKLFTIVNLCLISDNVKLAMTLIEGVGDEVTQFFALVVVILVGLIAWWSTRIADQPLIRTVLILERRTRHRVSAEQPPIPPTASSSLDNSIDTGQLESLGTNDENQQEIAGGATCEICNKETANISSPPAAASSSQGLDDNQAWELHENSTGPVNERCQASSSAVSATRNGNNFTEHDSQADVPAENNSHSYLLRSRRLAFFQSRQVTLLDSPVAAGPVLSTFSSADSYNIDTANSTNNEQGPTLISSNTNDDLPTTGSIRIRLKYLNDDQKLVEGRLHEQLGDFKR